MAVSLKKPSKSESLTIRLDPKTRFMLEFVSRLRGQTITTVVERAIGEAASRAVIEQGEYAPQISWRDYWSVSDAERALKLSTLSDVHPTFEEERRLDFARRWWQFFFMSSSCQDVDRQFADILWPDIDRYLEIEEEFRASDVLAPGEAMSSALKKAGLKPPQWIPNNAEIPF